MFSADVGSIGGTTEVVSGWQHRLSKRVRETCGFV